MRKARSYLLFMMLVLGLSLFATGAWSLILTGR